MKRWAATQLGPPRRHLPGRRPATDLRPLASGVRFAPASGSFEQRLTYERWMAPLVALEKRADLRPPVWLRVDVDERFPRLRLEPAPAAPSPQHYGPWRDKALAERAQRALEKLLRLRPCDFVFEPHPELPLGIGCFYAQVRSCAAPCLARIDEAGYRALALEAQGVLTDRARRPAASETWLPEHCGSAAGRALVVEVVGEQLDLFPVRAGTVLLEQARRVPASELEAALEGLAWDVALGDGGDWTWLADWLHEKHRRAQWLPQAAPASAASLAARVRVIT